MIIEPIILSIGIWWREYIRDESEAFYFLLHSVFLLNTKIHSLLLPTHQFLHIINFPPNEKKNIVHDIAFKCNPRHTPLKVILTCYIYYQINCTR